MFLEIALLVFALLGWGLFAWSQLRSKKMDHNMENSFKAMASEVLSQSTESLLTLASERLDKKTTEAKGAFDEKANEFKKLVDPIREVMTRMEKDIRDTEKMRLDHFGKLSQQITSVTEASDILRKEAHQLTSALRRPGVKGSWGELQLRRVVELAGMSSHCDFDEQASVGKSENRQRPDLVVSLPNNRTIVVDAKATTEAFHQAMEADSEIQRKQFLDKHAKQLRQKVTELSRKSYWEQFENTPEFVVLFVPNEALLYAAVEVDGGLLEHAMNEKVVIATPTNLVALLKAVAYGWQQTQLTENAQKVLTASKDLYDRLEVWMQHMHLVGKHLEQTVKSYNSSVGSFESRISPAAKKVRELGLQATDELTELDEVDLSVRELKERT